ncbi:MAG: 4Fe-4S binding protein, partial [Deltaproteobacteria bacterium]|nr:4Fe-4S binding protein [Deltaproteobacteria bacterium]
VAISGVRAICSMKHVGLNVASDVLMSLAYVGVKNGLVIVCADDPFMFSSQNEQDNRLYGKLSALPVLEPSSIQEAKDMTRFAFDLSEEIQEPVILRTTTRINHSSGVVTLGPIKKRVTKGSFPKDPFNYCLLPVVSRKRHLTLLKNYEKAHIKSDQSEYNSVYGNGKWGIVTNGVSFNYVMDAIKDLNIELQVRVLRVGFSNPPPDTIIKNFVKQSEKILIVEELEPYLEEAVKARAQEIGSTIPINGKGDERFPRMFEFDPGMVRKVIASYFGVGYQGKEPVDVSDIPEIPGRPPNLCAGCPHRATYAAVRKVLGDDAIYSNDIGCYSLGALPPLSAADFAICMGASIGAGIGFSRVTGKKVVSFIGDSTFFHSGIPGLIDAVHNGHDLTLIILDNGTTSMTGFQPNPGTDMGYQGLNNAKVSIEDVVRGIGIEHVAVVKPFKFKKTMEAIREATEFQGISVVISHEICPMYARTLPDKPKVRAFYIDQEKCKNHRECLNTLACPAFFLRGDHVEIDESICIGCNLCVQVCPENAIRPKR